MSAEQQVAVSARCIICEKTGQWVVALRWAIGSLPLRVHETRSLWECRHELQQFPASFLILEATRSNVDDVIQFLFDVHQSYPRARAVVLAERDLACGEDLLREAGAVHVAFSPRRLDAVARIAHRHLPEIVPPDVGLRESVRSRIPWAVE